MNLSYKVKNNAFDVGAYAVSDGWKGCEIQNENI